MGIEFFPDLASVVKALLGQETKGSEWEDAYVLGIGLAAKTDFGDQAQVDEAAKGLLKGLVMD